VVSVFFNLVVLMFVLLCGISPHFILSVCITACTFVTCLLKINQSINQSWSSVNSSFCPDITRNMSYIHSSPNLAITFVNDRTNWYCPQMSMLLSNKILFIGCYFMTFSSFVHKPSRILCFFLLFHYIVCMCVCHMF